jgi:hypothetical protein
MAADKLPLLAAFGGEDPTDGLTELPTIGNVQGSKVDVALAAIFGS